jgi:cytochrome b561
MTPAPEDGTGGKDRGYGIVARLFHWGMGILILVTVPVGIAMTSEGFDPVRDALYVAHKGIGAVILALLALRLAWRLVTPSPPDMPASVPWLQRRLATWTHRFLYLLLGIMAVTGYLRVTTGDFPLELLDALGIPPLLTGRPELSRTLSVIHAFTSYLLVATVAVHVAAAAHHALILRDGVFSRMWPPWRRDADTRNGPSDPSRGDDG